jgi:hypothetical protein
MSCTVALLEVRCPAPSPQAGMPSTLVSTSQKLNLKRTPRGRVWHGGRRLLLLLLLCLGRGWGGVQWLSSRLQLGKGLGLSRECKRLLLMMLLLLLRLLRKH